MPRKPILSSKIIKLLTKNHLLSVKKLMFLLKSDNKKYNKTSVYRALDNLMNQNLVCKQIFNDEAKFELKKSHHDHIVCNKCNKIDIIECKQKKYKIPKFKVNYHHMVVYGLCDDCYNKK